MTGQLLIDEVSVRPNYLVPRIIQKIFFRVWQFPMQFMKVIGMGK
jgi:hypothetical protein